MSKQVNVYILYNKKEEIEQKREKIDAFLSENDYKINEVFNEKNKGNMADISARMDFIDFIQRTGEANIEQIVFLNLNEVKSFDATTLDALLGVSNIKPLLVETDDQNIINDYGIYRAKQRAKQKQQLEQEKTRKIKKEKAKKRQPPKAPSMVYFPMEQETYPAHPIDWQQTATTEHAEYLNDIFTKTFIHMQLLTMPPGTGKTAVAVKTLGLMQKSIDGPLNIIITAPAKVIEQNGWHKTIQSWNNVHPDNQLNPILITSIDKFAKAGQHLPTKNRINKMLVARKSIIVQDEIHKYKNPTSIRSKQMQKFMKAKRLGLSATPITNNIITDMMSYLILAGFYKNKTQFEEHLKLDRFKSQERANEYLIYDQKTQKINTELWPEYHTMIHRMSEIMYRPNINLKDLDLPNVTNHVLQLETSEEMEADMRSLMKAHRKRMFDSATDLRMELTRRLHYDSYRLDQLMDIINDENTKQPLIFYENVIVQKYITDRLEKEGYNDYYIIAGASEYKELDDVTGEFITHKNDHLVDLKDADTTKKIPILIQYTSGSEGIEFKQSNTSIFYQNQYSYSILDQATGRNRRLRMEHDVHHYYFVADHPYDQNIYDVVTNRAKVSEETMDQIIETSMKSRYE